VRTATARVRAVLGLTGMVLSPLEDSHGTGNSVINTLGKAMNGLFEHSVCPSQEVGNAYATQLGRNAVWAERFQPEYSLPLHLHTEQRAQS
jgi:hypothetical protein